MLPSEVVLPAGVVLPAVEVLPVLLVVALREIPSAEVVLRA